MGPYLNPRPVPELEVAEWIGTPRPLAEQLGRVVLVETFQMLCPGCVSRGLPQAQRAAAAFPDVVVIGLHTVFEHHAVMTPDALRVFLFEYRIGFSVGIDRHDGGDIPVTMRTYGLQGTPSTLLIDRAGMLRFSAFGAVDDLTLGGALGRLLTESGDVPVQAAAAVSSEGTCRPGVGCD
jgi:hypothetical protein